MGIHERVGKLERENKALKDDYKMLFLKMDRVEKMIESELADAIEKVFGGFEIVVNESTDDKLRGLLSESTGTR